MNIKIFEPCEVITTTRYYPQFVTCKNAIYFFDRLSSNNGAAATGKFFKYDIETNTSVQLADCPLKLHVQTMFSFEDDIYVYAAYVSGKYGYNYMLKYSTKKNKWTFLNNGPYGTADVNVCKTCIVDNYCYIYSSNSANTFLRYSILEDSWKKLTSTGDTTDLRTGPFVHYKNKLYSIGGLAKKSYIWIYDIESDMWTKKTINTGIGCGNGILIDNCVYCTCSDTASNFFANLTIYKVNLDTFEVEILNGIGKMGFYYSVYDVDNTNMWGIGQPANGSQYFYPFCVNILDYETNTESEIVTNLNSQLKNINTIDKIIVDSLEEPNTKIRHAFSFDNRSTWLIYKDGEWKNINKDNILDNGMSKNEINNLVSDDFTKLNLNNSTLDVCSKLITYNDMFSPILRKITCKTN